MRTRELKSLLRRASDNKVSISWAPGFESYIVSRTTDYSRSLYLTYSGQWDEHSCIASDFDNIERALEAYQKSIRQEKLNAK